MTPHIHHFESLSVSPLLGVTTADETVLPVLGQGTVLLKTPQGVFRLENVQYVPGLQGPLLSTGALEDSGYGVNVSRNARFIYHESDPTTPVLDVELLQCSGGADGGKLYILPYDTVEYGNPPQLPLPENWETFQHMEALAQTIRGNDTSLTNGTWRTWHSRLAHLSSSEMDKLLKQSMVKGIQVTGDPCKLEGCPYCLEGKMTKTPFPSSDSLRKEPLSLIHMDLMGPIEVKSLNKKEYILVLVDDHTR